MKFSSDDSITDEGAFVDDITLRVSTAPVSGPTTMYLPLVNRDYSAVGVLVSEVIRTNESGTVVHPNGASIYVPEGAVPLNLAGEEGEMLFRIEDATPEDYGLPSTPPAGWEYVGNVCSMGPEGFIFQQPIRATIPLPADFDHEHYEVQMVDYDRTTGEFTSVGGQVNEDGITLSGDVLHLCGNLGIVREMTGKGYGAIGFLAVSGYSFRICIESYTLKYSEWDSSFDASYRYRSIIRRDSPQSPADGMQYWILPQATYTLSVEVYRHGDSGAPPEYLGFFQRTITIDGSHWDWSGGGRGPNYEFAVPFGQFAIGSSQLNPERPSCMGTPTPSVGVGAIKVTLD